jgi:hypothetical protein
MNVSNATVPVIYELGALWDRYGQTKLMNYITSISYTTVGPIGTFFNIISFLILRDKEFVGAQYDYLKVYTVNSALVCLVTSFFLFVNTARFLPWTNTYIGRAYNAFVYVPIANTGYFYGTFLDIANTLDRISKLKVKNFCNFSAYKVSMVGFAFCFLVNFGYFFVFEPGSRTFNAVITDEGTVIYGFTLWFFTQTKFARTELGRIVLYTIYVIRDLFMMIAEIVVNCVSVYYIQQFLKKKSNLVRPKSINPVTTNLTSNTLTITVEDSRPTMNSVKSKKETKKTTSEDSNMKAELRAAIMVVIMCALSVTEHIMLLTCIIYPFYNPNGGQTTNLLFWSGNFSIVFKHAANFPIFYAFNKNFKRIFWKYLKF